MNGKACIISLQRARFIARMRNGRRHDSVSNGARLCRSCLRDGRAVFEGICPELRIVVNYGDVKELRLLAVINNETGDEYSPAALKEFAAATRFKTPERLYFTLEEAEQK